MSVWIGKAPRILTVGAWAFSALVAAGAGWWAASATLQPPVVESPSPRPATYTVVEGTVERQFEFTAAASWPASPLATNAASGTVTSVDITPGQSVEPNDILYSVNERPVVVAEGDIPMYRGLSTGVDGRDVWQLQDLLVDLGYYHGEPSGVFTAGTADAVRQWQRDLGISSDGAVAQGDVVFVPTLPARVAVADGITVGRQVSAGIDAVEVLGEAPRFTVTLSDDQTDDVPPGADVEVIHDEGVWEGHIASMEGGRDGEVDLVLEGAAGGTLCGEECLDAVVPGEESRFRVRIVVIPETTGPLVPAAAIQTDASGAAFVTTPDGQQMPVTFTARDSGHAIVAGVEPGLEILLFGGASDGTPPGLEGDADAEDTGNE